MPLSTTRDRVVKLSRLRAIRERKALTQDELAELAGVSRQTVVKVEGGLEPRPTTVRKLAKALGVEPADLIGLQRSTGGLTVDQHERVEQLMAEHDAQAQRDRDLAQALGAIKHCISLLAWYIERTFTEAEQRDELAGYLDDLRVAVANVEGWS